MMNFPALTLLISHDNSFSSLLPYTKIRNLIRGNNIKLEVGRHEHFPFEAVVQFDNELPSSLIKSAITPKAFKTHMTTMLIF